MPHALIYFLMKELRGKQRGQRTALSFQAWSSGQAAKINVLWSVTVMREYVENNFNNNNNNNRNHPNKNTTTSIASSTPSTTATTNYIFTSLPLKVSVLLLWSERALKHTQVHGCHGSYTLSELCGAFGIDPRFGFGDEERQRHISGALPKVPMSKAQRLPDCMNVLLVCSCTDVCVLKEERRWFSFSEDE